MLGPMSGTAFADVQSNLRSRLGKDSSDEIDKLAKDLESSAPRSFEISSGRR
jgi:hypothetical protein